MIGGSRNLVRFWTLFWLQLSILKYLWSHWNFNMISRSFRKRCIELTLQTSSRVVSQRDPNSRNPLCRNWFYVFSHLLDDSEDSRTLWINSLLLMGLLMLHSFDVWSWAARFGGKWSVNPDFDDDHWWKICCDASLVVADASSFSSSGHGKIKFFWQVFKWL